MSDQTVEKQIDDLRRFVLSILILTGVMCFTSLLMLAVHAGKYDALKEQNEQKIIQEDGQLKEILLRPNKYRLIERP
jgi:hypothetical protein